MYSPVSPLSWLRKCITTVLPSSAAASAGAQQGHMEPEGDLYTTISPLKVLPSSLLRAYQGWLPLTASRLSSHATCTTPLPSTHMSCMPSLSLAASVVRRLPEKALSLGPLRKQYRCMSALASDLAWAVRITTPSGVMARRGPRVMPAMTALTPVLASSGSDQVVPLSADVRSQARRGTPAA